MKNDEHRHKTVCNVGNREIIFIRKRNLGFTLILNEPGVYTHIVRYYLEHY